MKRRDFVRIASATGALGLAGGGSLAAACGSGTGRLTGPTGAQNLPLYRPPTVSPEDLVLTARPTTAELAPQVHTPILTWGDGPVGPTIEARSGQRAQILLRNELQESTIAHWHGLRPPQEADGHPRFAIGPGGVYRYDFEIRERAAMYWYHPHPHMRTAAQTYFGMAGLFIVRDDEEDSLELPSGERELSVVLQDKRTDAAGRLVYASMGPSMMEGFLGDEGFANGVRTPTVAVASGLYRLRILSAANARIFRLALSTGAPFVLIGTDGGLLEASAELRYLDMGTGERADLLVDFSGLRPGTTVSLRSLDFPSPALGMGMGMMGPGAGGLSQGAPMELLHFVVTDEVREEARIPSGLTSLPRLARGEADRVRDFRFRSMMMSHTINGRSFEVDRIDERVPFGATEVWRFVNEGPFPHPVHMHAVHFQVLSRSGGRGQVLPWEQGWKDTVLTFPGETVDVIARFDSHRGLFLMHCHNLEHEDMGMMMNFLIE